MLSSHCISCNFQNKMRHEKAKFILFCQNKIQSKLHLNCKNTFDILLYLRYVSSKNCNWNNFIFYQILLKKITNKREDNWILIVIIKYFIKRGILVKKKFKCDLPVLDVSEFSVLCRASLESSAFIARESRSSSAFSIVEGRTVCNRK